MQQTNIILSIPHQINTRTQLTLEPPPIRSCQIQKTKVDVPTNLHQLLEQAEKFSFGKGILVELGVGGNGGGAGWVGGEVFFGSGGYGVYLFGGEPPAVA